MELLHKHFDTAIESPDGIKKLRDLILTLAMQGKLVKQDPKDQPASELLKEIHAEKERLIKEGKVKKQKDLPPIKPEEVPYAVPKGWVWTRLGDCSQNIHYGYTASADFQKTEFRLLRITDIQNNHVNWESVPGCDIHKDEAEKYVLKQNDILIARTGGTVGKTYLVDNVETKAIFASYLIRVIPSPFIYIYFLKSNLESPFYWEQLYEKCSGTGQPNVNGVSLSLLLIPLPPLAEQKRIVAKIDELMALCDKLKAQCNDRNDKRLAVHTAAINRLLTAADTNDFDSAWQFITRHFDPLYSVKENVAELKKAILTLAMQGKLVKQDSKDQPASDLLKEIQAEKERLIKEGMIKKQKELPPIKPEEVPYAVPEGWIWIRLGELCSKITDGEHQTPPRIDNGYRLLSAKNVRDGFIDYDNCDLISKSHYENARKRCLPEKGDLLIVSVGGTIGRTSLITDNTDFALVRSVAIVKPLRLNSFFLRFAFSSPLIQSIIHATKRGGAQPCLYLSEIEQFIIPIPPLAEQNRIVAKIDELMALCDKLEALIDQVMAKQTTLFDAVLAKV